MHEQYNFSIDLVIPVYNEEKTLLDKIGELSNYILTLNNYNISIIIADNGSTDKTSEIASELQNQNSHIRLLKVNKKGVGLALKKAWSESKADVIACMDLDLSTNLTHINEAIEKIYNHNYQLVYGSRLLKQSKVIGRTLKREITSRVFNWIIRTYLGVPISDTMCGFIFLKRDIFHDLMNKGAQSDRWFFQAEVLIVGYWQNYKICELPVIWKDDPDSKVKVLPLAMEYVKAMSDLKHSYSPKR